MDSNELRGIRESSIRLPDGGDTHFHIWENGRGATLTTRIPGYEEHWHFDRNGNLLSCD